MFQGLVRYPLNQPKIFVAVPNLGKIRTGLVEWLLYCHSSFLHPQTPIKGIINLNIDRPVEVNRNKIANKFLETDCTHLLMIDDDIQALPNLIPNWVKYDKDIIGGYIPIWNKELQHPRFFAYNFVNGKSIDIDPKLGFQRCDMVGTGAIMFKRKVIETIPNPRFKQVLKQNGEFRMGEDQYFCELARNAGFEIWVDPTPMGHLYEFDIIETVPKDVK